jgi:serine/threonine protein phosphatase 1
MNWIIGDIHGCWNTLKALVEHIKAVDESPTFIFLGDYVDRGLFAYETIDFLINLSKQYPCTFIKGNHDDMWMGTCKVRPYLEPCWNPTGPGYNQTVRSYEAYTNGVSYTMPPHHQEFFRSLEFFKVFETKTGIKFGVSHAKPPRIEILADKRATLNDNDKHDVMWARIASDPYQIEEIEKMLSEVGISLWLVGHTPSAFPRFSDWRSLLFLDTGAYAEGHYLTAYCVETGIFLQELNTKDFQPDLD